MSKVALVAGSTGLIGSQLVELLLSDLYYSKVIAISRRPLSITHTRLENVLMEIDQLPDHNQLTADDVFCCLGTTMKQAGSKEAFRKVDFDFPVQLAKLLKTNGAKQFLLVSALGSNKNSSIFYNQVKGEVEEAIATIGYPTLHVFKPSLLTGSRKEKRAGEDVAKIVYKYLGFLIPEKYKSIEAIKVARAMQAATKQSQTGVIVHESASMQHY